MYENNVQIILGNNKRTSKKSDIQNHPQTIK